MKKILYVCSAIAVSSIHLGARAMDYPKTSFVNQSCLDPGMVVAQSLEDGRKIHAISPPLPCFLKTSNDAKGNPEPISLDAYGFHNVYGVRLNSDGTFIVYGSIGEKSCLKHIDLYKNESRLYDLDGLTERISFIKHPNGFSYICGEYKNSDIDGKIIIYDENQEKIATREIISLQDKRSFYFRATQMLIDYNGRLYLWGRKVGFNDALFEMHQNRDGDIISISEKKIPPKGDLSDIPLIPKKNIPGIIYLIKRNLITILQEDGTFSEPDNFGLKIIMGAVPTLYPNPNLAVYLYGCDQNDKPLIVKIRKDASATRIQPFEVGITTIFSVEIDLANALYIKGYKNWVVRDDSITNCFPLESGSSAVPLMGYETIQPVLRHYKPAFLNTSGSIRMDALKNLCDDLCKTLKTFTWPGFSNEDNLAFYNLFLILSREIAKTKNIENIAELYNFYTKLGEYRNSPMFEYIQILEYELFGGKETFLQNDFTTERFKEILEVQRRLQLATPLMSGGDLKDGYLQELQWITSPPLDPVCFSDNAMNDETNFAQSCLKPGMVVVHSCKTLKGDQAKDEPETSYSMVFTFLDEIFPKKFEFTLKDIKSCYLTYIIYLVNKEIHIIDFDSSHSLSSIIRIKNGEELRDTYGSTSHNMMANPLKLNLDGTFIVYSFVNQKECLQHINLYENVSKFYDVDGLTELKFIKNSNGRSYVAGKDKEGIFEIRIYDENQEEIKNLRNKLDSNLYIRNILMDYNNNIYLSSSSHLCAMDQTGKIVKTENIPPGRYSGPLNHTPGIIYFINASRNLMMMLQEDGTFSKPDNLGFKKIAGSAPTLHPNPNPAVYFYGTDQSDKPLIIKVDKDTSTTRIQSFKEGTTINSMAVDLWNTLYIDGNDQNSKPSIWVIKNNGTPTLFYSGSESARIVGIQSLIGFETIQPLLMYHKPLLYNGLKGINLDALKCLSDNLCKTLKTYSHPGFSAEDNLAFYDLFLALSRNMAETENIEGIKILYNLYTKLGEYRKSPMFGYVQILEYELFGGLDKIYKLNKVVTEEKILQDGLDIECFQRTLEAQRRLQLATSLISTFHKDIYLEELKWITDATTRLPGSYKN